MASRLPSSQHSVGATPQALKHYENQDYPSQFFHAVTKLKEDSLLADLLIGLNGGSWRVHSVVLAAVSSLVMGELRQGRKQDLCLDGRVGEAGLETVLKFAYSGEVELSRENLSEVKQAAGVLGAEKVLKLCQDFEQSSGNKTEEWRSLPEKIRRANLQCIRAMWEEQLICDVKLEVDGVYFYVHRAILAAGSDFFRGMFTSGMKEASEDTIPMFSLSPEELSALLSFIYSGTLQLGWDNAFELTLASMQIQSHGAISLCMDFLHGETDPQSCLDVAAFAEAYSLGELKEFADDYVLRNFQEVGSTPKFQDLSLDQLSRYLAEDSLCASNELEVFRVVVGWIRADQLERLAHAEELMKLVRFPLMTFRQFKEVREVNISLKQEGCNDLYAAALQEFGWTSGSMEQHCRVRKPSLALVLVAGDQKAPDFASRKPSRDLWFSNSFSRSTGLRTHIEWCHLSTMPGPGRFRHATVVLDNNLYVFGGSDFYGKCDTLKTAFRYDPSQDSWKQLPDMKEPRNYCSAVIQNQHIYILGGDIDTEHNLGSVECYNPTTNSWRYAQPLDQALSGHGAVSWNGEIYVSGGFNCNYHCLVSMFHYHPEKGTIYLADMNHDRAEHVMEAIRDKMYVAGGVRNQARFYSDQFVCEVYDPSRDSWTLLARLPKPHVNAASGVLEEKLYVLGGFSQEDYTETGLAHRYDPRWDNWETVGRMPGPTTDIRACVLALPPHLRH
ncbi:kelch-like protein 33 [Acipenser ruthenus]|uniref:kelch-like protein 33 n=1 Tax=Acipenser ruthenus TaxID=7906 RepID=UPI0027404DA1|nr:kelch-like protein 33 [Acipenser ruthenus]